jgi:hypothetical protein
MISYPGRNFGDSIVVYFKPSHHGFAMDGYTLMHAGSPTHLLARLHGELVGAGSLWLSRSYLGLAQIL